MSSIDILYPTLLNSLFNSSRVAENCSGFVTVPPLAMYPGMWLNMVNIKPPSLVNLEIESMKKIILEYKRYAQKGPRQLLRSMQ